VRAPAPLPQFPANLVLEGRPCLVVGGGEVAARKAQVLLDCGARVRAVAPSVGEAMRDMAGLAWEERPYCDGEAAGYRLVVAATDDPETNRRVYLDGEAAGVWVNAADDPASCSVTLPSVARRGPILLTVSTGGLSPALASWLRDQFASQLGPEHEALAEILSEERESVKREGTSTVDVDWKRAIGSDMLDLLRAGRVDEARERLRACLSS
jgi:siroheme synthase-like protein